LKILSAKQNITQLKTFTLYIYIYILTSGLRELIKKFEE